MVGQLSCLTSLVGVQRWRLNWHGAPVLEKYAFLTRRNSCSLGRMSLSVWFDCLLRNVLRKFDCKVSDICDMASLSDDKVTVAGFADDTPRRIEWSELEIK